MKKLIVVMILAVAGFQYFVANSAADTAKGAINAHHETLKNI